MIGASRPALVFLAVSSGVIPSGGCSVAVDLPPLLEEESSEACRNDVDDDLDGEMNCADPACSVFCPDGDGVPPPVFECFTDATRDLAFRRVGTDPVHCEPAPDREVVCEADEHLLPGAEGCRRIGQACPAEWPALEEPQILYVREGSSSGDGTRERPFGSLAQALAASEAGDTIALGPGTYDAARIDVDVRLRGACVAATTVRGLDVAASVTLEDLKIAGDLAVGGSLVATGVLVEGNTSVRGEATFDDVRFVASGTALQIEGEASLTACTVSATEAGVLASGAVELVAVGIADTSVVAVEAQAEARLTGVSLDLADGAGFVTHCSSSDAAPCAVLHQVQIATEPTFGDTSLGLDLRGPTEVTNTRVLGMAVGGVDARADVSLMDVTIEDGGGFGARFRPGTTAVLVDAIVEGNAGEAVIVDSGASLSAANLSVEGPFAGTSESCVVLDGTLEMTNFRIESCPQCGLLVGANSRVALSDGFVTKATRGACVARRASTTVADLTRRVTYRENATNVDVLER